MLEFAAPIRVQMLSWVFCIFKVESVANPAGIRRILVIPLNAVGAECTYGVLWKLYIYIYIAVVR